MAVACKNSPQPSGNVAKDQLITQGADQPTTDREVSVTQTPTEPEREVTSAKGKAQGGKPGSRVTPPWRSPVAWSGQVGVGWTLSGAEATE